MVGVGMRGLSVLGLLTGKAGQPMDPLFGKGGPRDLIIVDPSHWPHTYPSLCCQKLLGCGEKKYNIRGCEVSPGVGGRRS